MSAAPKVNYFKAIDFLIRVEKGPDAGKAYRIQPPQITIGRDSKCQITLSDPKVSRQQCAIHFKDEVFCIDLSSRKTTLVNGKPCKNQALRPGDIISFGQTTIRFLTKTNENAQAQLPGQGGAGLPKTNQKKKNSLLPFVAVLVLLAGFYFYLDDSAPQKENRQLLTQDDVNKQIEESKERLALRNEAIAEKRKLSQKKYLYNVEKHFISGFRDFQNGQYNRAIESFGTTMATDQNHEKAMLYRKSAKKKHADLIDTHMRDGARYRDKMMYNRCAAEFEKALILINNRKSKKFELAKSQLNECRLLKTGGY